MPHHKSSKKRVRQTNKRTHQNKMKTSKSRTAIKNLRAALDAGDKEKATSLLTKTQSLLARMAKTGIIKDNTAARKTSRLAKAVKSL